jgi:hypothetical protein
MPHVRTDFSLNLITNFGERLEVTRPFEAHVAAISNENDIELFTQMTIDYVA